MSGVRVTLALSDPLCPVAELAEREGTAVTDVTRSNPTEGRVTEEVTVREADTLSIGQPVFENGEGEVRQFERGDSCACVCEHVEDQGIPVSDVAIADGTIRVTFYIEDTERVTPLLEGLRENYGSATLVRAQREGDEVDIRTVDIAALTDRQREVLRTANDMGYFQHPRGAHATDVAEELDISVSTFSEHLRAAEAKVIDSLVADGL